ncbi:DUF2945 domain-containing protein [Sphingomonas sp. LT1P40]|uniref:DUF2945 domain-containing protein n=1 Tax=Alteristakelama amylovorans TaxID=3096166 RepID=UPI002FC93050
MAQAFKPGVRVSWKSHGHTAKGEVLHKQTSDMVLKGHQVRASREEPQYIVKSDNGGKASHKPSALNRI